MPLAGLVFRLIKGTPLTAAEGDSNLRKIRDFCNSLEQLFGVVLKPNGTLKDGAVGSTSVIADGVVTAAKLAADAKFPAGAMVDFGGAVAPSGWLLCDGSPVSRTTYAALFAAIGTTFGPGDGSTTFNVPDIRGRTTIGAGTGAGLTARTVGQTLGVETVTLTGRQSGIQQHSHAAWNGAPQWVFGGALTGSAGDYAHIHGTDASLATQNTGHTDALDSHQNMQPSLVATKIIKY